jgi:hypothetical protein
LGLEAPCDFFCLNTANACYLSAIWRGPGGYNPSATIHIGLTSYDGNPDGTPDGSGKFFGYVKDSSDTRVVPVAVPVEVDVMNASDYS